MPFTKCSLTLVYVTDDPWKALSASPGASCTTASVHRKLFSEHITSDCIFVVTCVDLSPIP